MAFVVKAALGAQAEGKAFSFVEKTMYRGKEIRVGDEIFVFDSDHRGGQGLCARGVVTAVAPGPGIRSLGRPERLRVGELVDDPEPGAVGLAAGDPGSWSGAGSRR